MCVYKDEICFIFNLHKKSELFGSLLSNIDTIISINNTVCTLLWNLNPMLNLVSGLLKWQSDKVRKNNRTWIFFGKFLKSLNMTYFEIELPSIEKN